MTKVCVVTGSRADYGLLKQLLKEIDASRFLELQLVVTGSHLSPSYAKTKEEIIGDGFKIDSELEILLSSDSTTGVCKSAGLTLLGVPEILERLRPDLLLVLGDRYEILSVAMAATIMCIPLGHIHGGELTAGSYDNSFRHAITKFSQIHFVATEEYKNRVLQLGENKEMVFNVGSLGVEALKKIKLLSRTDLEKKLGITFSKKAILVTYHPVTLENSSLENQISELLGALGVLQNTTIIFTMPNADNGSKLIKDKIHSFASERQNIYIFESLGQLNYFSLVSTIDVVLGNSSSGLIEVPSFGKPTINIGSRQDGRTRAKSVVDVPAVKKDILEALQKIESHAFIDVLKNPKNPYEGRYTSKKIVKIIESIDFSNFSVRKEFIDHPICLGL